MEENATSQRIIEPIKLEAYQCPVCEIKLFTDLETATKHVNRPVQPILPAGFVYSAKREFKHNRFNVIIIESPGSWCKPRNPNCEYTHSHEQKAIIYDPIYNSAFEELGTDPITWSDFCLGYKTGHIQLLSGEEIKNLQKLYDSFHTEILNNYDFGSANVRYLMQNAPKKLVRTTHELEKLLKHSKV